VDDEGIEAEYGDEADKDQPEGHRFGKDKSDDEDSQLYITKKGGKGGIFDKDENDSDVEEYLEGLENDEFEMDGLKLPSDAGDDDSDEPGLDDYDDEEDFMKGVRDDYDQSDDAKGSKADEEEDEEDNENDIEDVFARADENQEMNLVEQLREQAEKPQAKENFINSDLVKKIEQIEDEMMNPKSWQLTGEATNKERPLNSLLDVHLDFNAATKLPPTITKEVTIRIEELIK